MKKMSVVAIAAASLLSVFAPISTADALTSWRTFGHGWVRASSVGPMVGLVSETTRNPRAIRFVVDTHHDGRGDAQWELTCVNRETGRTGQRTGERTFWRRLTFKFTTLPLDRRDSCLLFVIGSSRDPSRVDVTLQARYP